MNENLQQIIDACVPILCLLITAGGAYLVALMRKKAALLQKEIDNDTAAKYIDMACDAVDQAVTFTAQTFVDALKAENAFTKEKQLEAFNMARTKVLEILSYTTVEALYEIYGDFDAWLDSKIEQVCREIKEPTVEVAPPSVVVALPEMTMHADDEDGEESEPEQPEQPEQSDDEELAWTWSEHPEDVYPSDKPVDVPEDPPCTLPEDEAPQTMAE